MDICVFGSLWKIVFGFLSVVKKVFIVVFGGMGRLYS